MDTTIEYMVYGKYALFTDPMSKTGGEKFTYPVPTYGALAGITDTIYWKPTLKWYIDDVRVMKKIERDSRTYRITKYNGGVKLSTYTYLYDVAYQVRAHFEWNRLRPDMKKDRNYAKHISITRRRLECGGSRQPFLGTSECLAYIEPCRFGSGEGYYDHDGISQLGIMLHSAFSSDPFKDIPDVRLWAPQMVNGVIHFERPERCLSVKKLEENDEAGRY